MKIPKMKIRVLDPIFHQMIFVLLNYTQRDVDRFFKSMNCTNIDPKSCRGLQGFSTIIETEGESNRYIVWVKGFQWTLQDQNTLIHEIIHTVMKIWDFNTMKVSIETQEFFAHTVGNVFEKIGQKILISQKRRKK